MNAAATCARFWLLGLLVVAGLYAARGPLVVRALPVLRAAAQLVADDFTFLAVEIPEGDGGRTLLVRAHLAAPLWLGGRWVRPFDVRDATVAEYRVTVSITGLFAYAALLMTVLLAWPFAAPAEYLIRLACFLPLLGVLLLLDAPFAIAAELWNLIYTQYAPGKYSSLMIFSRFMMGGGGFLLGGLFAALAIGGSRRAARRWIHPSPTESGNDDAVTWNARRRSSDAVPLA